MRKIMEKLRGKNLSILMLNAVALLLVIQNVNVACAWVQHQPEVPEEAKCFKKF